MVSIGATFSHCQVQQERELEGRSRFCLSEFSVFCSVKNYHSFYVIDNDEYGSHLMSMSVSCTSSTCWESFWVEALSKTLATTLEILTGQGLSEIADLGAEACMTWMIKFVFTLEDGKKMGMFASQHILMHRHHSTCGWHVKVTTLKTENQLLNRQQVGHLEKLETDRRVAVVGKFRKNYSTAVMQGNDMKL